MSAESLRRAAALMRDRAEEHDQAMRETPGEVHGGPNANWTPVFLSSAILAHPHVLDDDPDVVRVVTANVEAMAPWADSRISLAVADLLDKQAERLEAFEEKFSDRDAWPRFRDHQFGDLISVATAYLGEAS